MMREIWVHILSRCICFSWCRLLSNMLDPSGEGSISYRPNYQAAWGRELTSRKQNRYRERVKNIRTFEKTNKRKEKTFSTAGEQKDDETQGHTEAKYRHGIMCKAWNNCITEKGHQPSNTFKAEKCIFWSCPGKLMQWCKIMRVCRTAMKIRFKIQFASLPHFSFVKKENKTQTTLQLRYASKGESHWCDWYWHRYNHLKESRS